MAGSSSYINPIAKRRRCSILLKNGSTGLRAPLRSTLSGFGSEGCLPVSCAVRTVERSDPLSIITTSHRSTSNIAPDFSAGQQREYKAAVERFAGSQGKAHGQSIDIDDGMKLARAASAAIHQRSPLAAIPAPACAR